MTSKSDPTSPGRNEPYHAAATVDIVFRLDGSSSSGSFTEKRIRKVNTRLTTYKRLQTMARFLLKIRPDVELWLIEDDLPSCLGLQPSDSISGAITRDCTLLVEPMEKGCPQHCNDQISSIQTTATAAALASPSPMKRLYNPVSCVPKRPSPKHARGLSPRHDFEELWQASPSSPTPSEVYHDTDCDTDYAWALSFAACDNDNPHRSNMEHQLGASLPAGSIIAHASCTQFSMEGGQSACTSICLVAASSLLSQTHQASNFITTGFLDYCLEVGVVLHQSVIAHDHTSVDDLWGLEGFLPLVDSLVRRDTPLTGSIGDAGAWAECLMTTLSYAQAEDSCKVALIVTKPPESILLVCQNVVAGAPWLLFDSHGHELDTPKRAYAQNLDSLELAAMALCQKFPAIPGLEAEESIQMQQLNMFEAHPILLSPSMEEERISDRVDIRDSVSNNYLKDNGGNAKLNRRKRNQALSEGDWDDLFFSKLEHLDQSRDDNALTQAHSARTVTGKITQPEQNAVKRNKSSGTHCPAPSLDDKQGTTKSVGSFLSKEPSTANSVGSFLSKEPPMNTSHGESVSENKSPKSGKAKNTAEERMDALDLTLPLSARAETGTETQETVGKDSKPETIGPCPERADKPGNAVEPPTNTSDSVSTEESHKRRKGVTLHARSRRPSKRFSGKKIEQQSLHGVRSLSSRSLNTNDGSGPGSESKVSAQGSNDSGTKLGVGDKDNSEAVRPNPGQATTPRQGAPPPKQPALHDSDDLVRDSITSMLFADPVFCDKGHTHERSTIEAHFRARREMKEQAEAEGGNSEDQCGTGSNFDPTCPLTGEAISDILIPNEQCDRMLPVLIENGLVPLEEGELEEWRERREEKKDEAKKRQDAEAASRRASEAEAEPTAEHESSSLQNSTQSDSNTVHILRPLAPLGSSSQAKKLFDLGLAVALATESAAEKPPGDPPSVGARCTNMCCRASMQPRECQFCARCLQLVCTDCLRFRVNDVGETHSTGGPRVCPNCVLQISEVLAESGSPESQQRVEAIDSMMSEFFVQVKNCKAAQQQEVLHYERHQQYNSFKQEKESLISNLELTKASLQQNITEAKAQADAARLDGRAGREVALLGELQTKVSELQGEYDKIDWSEEEGVIRGSLLEHDLNEANAALAVARSVASDNAPPAGLTPRQRRISELENQRVAKEVEHAAHIEKGPIDEADFHYAILLSRLSEEFEKLSAELGSLKKEEESFPISTGSAKPPKSKARARARDSCSSNSRLRRRKSAVAKNRCERSSAASVTKSVGGLLAYFRGKSTTNNSEASDSADCSESSCFPVDASRPVPAFVEEPKLNAQSVQEARADLAVIGVIGVEELVLELPLGLHYLSLRMRNQVRILRTDLELARIESERFLEEEYRQHQEALESRLESIEDQVVELRKACASAKETAEGLQRERIARRDAADRERQRRESERRKEEERLQAERRRQERDTREALRGLDLRQCGGCGFGPFEKFNCNDMRSHNYVFNYMDENGRRQRRRRNECPQCRWTHADWNRWPRFQP